MLLRYKYRNHKNRLPMQHFTQEELKPSEHVLNMIRQIAYSYRAIKMNGRTEVYCLN